MEYEKQTNEILYYPSTWKYLLHHIFENHFLDFHLLHLAVCKDICNEMERGMFTMCNNYILLWPIS